jgi:hypothetical protein
LEDIDKIRLMRLIKKLKESLIDVKKLPRDDADILHVRQEIEVALQYALRYLSNNS